MGAPNFRYKLTDSPDYKSSCGDEYTERQLRILNREIALSEGRVSELTKLKNKALTSGDEENCELAVALYEKKLYPAEKHFWDSWTVECAQKGLQDLTPWDRSYLTEQK